MQSIRSRIYNRYDIYLFIIIVSTIYGKGGIVHPTTFLSMLFLPELFKSSNILGRYGKAITHFFIFWFFYAVMSLLWVKDYSNAYTDLFFLFVHMSCFLEMIIFAARAKRPLYIIAGSWAFAFFISSTVGVWEILTDHHLQSAKEMSEYYTNSPTDFYKKKYAAFTFYNPNTYCTFISMVFPFLLYMTSLAKNKKIALASTVLSLVAVFIMSRNSSRGGTVAMTIMFFLFILYRFKIGKGRTRRNVFFVVIIVFAFLYYYGDVFFGSLLFRLENRDVFEDQSRTALLYASWNLFLQSKGLGCGVGSMTYELAHTPFNITRFFFSHNMVMEMLIDFGAIVVIGFLLFLAKLLFRARQLDNLTKSIILGSLFAFPFYSVINSENVRPHFIWVYFASIYIFSVYKEKKILA